jgi:squalene-associated FAD-dependent desaturase
MQTLPQRVAIVGGGWAGLAAAVELSRQPALQQIQVTLFESAPQLGGRARSIEWKGMALDNGQHLMIGAYQQMLALLKTLQADEKSLFDRLPHHLLMLDAQSGNIAFELKLPTYPAPLHLLFGVLGIKQLSLSDKLKLLWRFNRLLNTPIVEDLSVSDWLDQAQLPETYHRYLLEPLCLAALTTHPAQASARAFQSVLLQTFNAPADHTDLLIARKDLGQVFPAQATDFIQQHGGVIHTRSKVQRLLLDRDDNGRLGVQLKDRIETFDQLILATPPVVSARLLAEHPQTAPLAASIEQLQYEPVANLYLQFAEAVCLPCPMMGLVNGVAEWVFERASSGQPQLLAVVISAQGPHLQMSPEALRDQVLAELQRVLGPLPDCIDSQLIVEKRATVQCHPGVDALRPSTQSGIANLQLCGDYVYIEENNQPALPSTLEGALRSGVKCAQHIIQQSNH